MLRFDAVACVRGGRVLFEDLSFNLEPGGAVLVTGPNGAGKSSLIRVAAGLLRAVAGGGRRRTGPRLADRGGVAPTRNCRWRRRSASGRGSMDAARAVADALGAMALTDLAAVPVRLLSTGQRRRAAFARVMASGAPVWLLDEPANGLDAAALGLLEAAIARHREGGGVVLVASHTPIDLPDALTIPLRLPGERRGPVTGGPQLGPGLRRGSV